jgi:hypothetical protein
LRCCVRTHFNRQYDWNVSGAKARQMVAQEC